MMALRVLYVDDDPALARLASRVLGRHGMEVVHAASVASGLDLFQNGQFDVVVLDHYFQAATGMEFLAAIETVPARVPVLYVTGSNEAQIAIDALKAGAADYVIKNVGDDFFPLLLAAINQALENHRLRQTKEEADRLLIKAKEHAEMMVKEMNHRIANSLSLVSAMIRLQINTLKSQEAETALLETQSRISAIAGVHRSLYNTANVGLVSLNSYLTSIISDLFQAVPGSSSITVETSLCEVDLNADHAVALGVIVTELLTNALKYAYPDQEGTVRINLSAQDGRFILVVEDDGVGVKPDSAPRGTGLGTKLIMAMAQNIGARVEQTHTHPELKKGTRFSMIWNER
ncbi:sensor histidine kinase [Agrobacterium pusense]|jgi:two-component sensor histidine kinase/CheY-like chemotaxis protein|uniref:histidine kinase n=1 Tax=Agrobacterium pusense TaxID=648995 RepID=U4Q3I0_9HYPH|nr:response regulator [Agrobacterium pusense]OAI84367.1 two-component system sensor histidine kinase/response regulator [Rhizobium sp. GHKF11]MBW9078861.1 response regulator [Agrobacterium pusense]MDR6191327.1 two-component sensor histidine kinase/CheY-like chemotaxis protein [Agrobacterium pusense]NRF09523.1 response regulator [Agrobacterium pusense]NRF19572.1 response regulator [Agrobacterium pusense]